MKCSEAVRAMEEVGIDQSLGDARRLRSHLERCLECRKRALAYDALDARIAEALRRTPEYRDQADAVLDELVPYSRPQKVALRWAWAAAACAAAAAAVGYGLIPRPAGHHLAAPRAIVQRPQALPPLPLRQEFARNPEAQPSARRARHREHIRRRSREILRQASHAKTVLAAKKPALPRAPGRFAEAETLVYISKSGVTVSFRQGSFSATRTIRAVRKLPPPSQDLAGIERPPLPTTSRTRFTGPLGGS